MTILDHFMDLMTQTAYIYKKVDSYDESTGTNTITWSLLETVNNAAFYQGAAAERFLGDKFKAEVDGMIILNPNYVTYTIEDSYRIDINNISYSVVHSDNILLLDEIYAVGVKRFESV